MRMSANDVKREDEQQTLDGRSFGPQLERRGFLCLCGHVLLVVGDDERDEADRTRVRDSHIRHKNPPLSPAPRLPCITAQHKDAFRLKKRVDLVGCGLC